MSYADKLQELLKIEASMQRRWEEEKIFELDAPTPGSQDEQREKYMTNFPFPYMNGRAHLGHTFTFSKCEFSAGFQRMLGKRCTFPFAMHCTGMPIKACADKLKREMREFGYPPRFPDQEETQGGPMYQWQIMASMGLSDEEIKPFSDARHWLTYFPHCWINDMKRMGIKIDWRRNYISTDANPYFDSFVHWTFIRLKERQRIKFGKRYTMFSPREGQPCMDHDRSAGEDVGLQEFTLIKLKVKAPYPAKLAALSSKNVYLVAATLRPETMFGQTNCWVRPDMKYVAIETKNGDVFICTRRAARNMSYQGMTPDNGSLNVLAELVGQEIVGVALEAPLTSYKTIYTLPSLKLEGDKGTGILPSVPSENPDDFVALRDLQTSHSLREQVGVTEKMVAGFQPAPIINVPGFGNLSAVTACAQYTVNSQEDGDRLLQAIKSLEGTGLKESVMLVGNFKGQKVLAVRKTIQKQLIEKGEALVYMEPEKPVLSRSGSECVAALCDQWYLDYGAPDWRAMSKCCLTKMNLFVDEVRADFEKVMDDLDEHACSRTDGLGSRIPWDRQYLIENMSDSNINMAYYTVCPLIQGYSWDGSKPGPANIRPEQLTPEVWDYVFLKDKAYPGQCGIPRATLDRLKREFDYWYPVNDRMSGKDLIPNNLTYYIYGHTAMWPDDESKWPKAIRANGHLLINSKKMSKSTGNFCTMIEAIERFSADGMRLTLADAGDGIENANFVEKEAEVGMLRLHSLLQWVRDTLAAKSTLRHGEYTFNDKVFASEINKTNKETRAHYGCYLYKAALRTGFFDFQAKLSRYIEAEPRGVHHDLVFRFIEVQVLLMAPICPHMAEHIWGLLGKKRSIMWATWPEAGEVDLVLLKASQHLDNCVSEFKMKRKTMSGSEKLDQLKPSPATHATIWVAASGQSVKSHYEESEKNHHPKHSEVDLHVSEMELLKDNSDYIARTLGLAALDVKKVDDFAKYEIKTSCSPGKPLIIFHAEQTFERARHLHASGDLFRPNDHTGKKQ